MNYDVFISSKSEDYHLAKEVYNFLKANGLSVFIASEELKKIGEAQYANAIDEVLDDSIHMIVVASSVYNIKSKWVKYEWSTFSNDLKSGYRDGNLLTILSGDIELKTLPASLRHQQSFNFRSYKDEILDYLNIDKRCEQHNTTKQNTSAHIAVFKFYSNENCQIMLEGKLIANIIGMSDEPYCIPISRKGDYRFKCINSITAETQTLKEHIDADEERDIDIYWGEHKAFIPDQEWPEAKKINGDTFIVELGNIQFEMLRVDGGTLEIGATKEQEADAESNEYPAHKISLPTFYIGRFPITQNIWETVMGYNKS
ncbi:MAG: TIR domain-containing protein, partial [Bacteroidaceae bacterium]|nr:TIR domain-containing protein [Bacteroidaceae bacterium]